VPLLLPLLAFLFASLLVGGAALALSSGNATTIERRLAEVAGESMRPLDITPGLFAVLVLVEANPGLKQSDLARAVHLDRSTVVSVIDNLERRQLLERHAAANDRRSNALRLTSSGAALLRRLKQRVARHEKRLARGLDAGERATLVALLGRIFPEHR